MLYTNQDLLTAIEQDDLATVQAIITVYQAKPSDPTLLFSGGDSSHSNALLFALALAKKEVSNSLAIVNALLAVRDQQGQAVLDLNAVSHDPRRPSNERLTVFFYVLQSDVPAKLRYELLNTLLNTKGRTDSLNPALSAGLVSALHQTVYLEDVACFNLLSNYGYGKKKSDGTPVFDLNRLFAYSKKTLLDSAIEISGKSSMISQAIRQAGGFTCQELRDQQERYVRGQLRGVLLTTIATVMIPEIVSNRKERVTPCSAVGVPLRAHSTITAT